MLLCIHTTVSINPTFKKQVFIEKELQGNNQGGGSTDLFIILGS
jgi:hypothetical protein